MTIYTRERGIQFCQRFADGGNVADICLDPGKPARQDVQIRLGVQEPDTQLVAMLPTDFAVISGAVAEP